MIAQTTLAQGREKGARVLASSMAFLGALLLFSMEPMLGRMLTVHFGGVSSVWLTCLMFFQVMLFLGYLYAHLLGRRIGPWHLLLLLVPFLNIPFRIGAVPGFTNPSLQVLGSLVIHAALAFGVLSTTAVISQVWLAGSSSPTIRAMNPYPLYAASNAGSFFALLGYVFLAEPLMGLRNQTLLWSSLYACYCLVAAGTWFTLRPTRKADPPIKENPGQSITGAPSWSTRLDWLILSGLPSGLLLALTNFVSLETGSFPLIWTVPLALYLLSFVVTFRDRKPLPRPLHTLWIKLPVAALVVYFIAFTQGLLFIVGQFLIFFLLCLVAHGLLYRMRPPAEFLTHFYLTLSLGGLIGGATVALGTPYLLKGPLEYPILLFILSLVLGMYYLKSFLDRVLGSRPVWRKALYFTQAVLILAAVGGTLYPDHKSVYRHRNFYGIYRVIEERVAQEPFSIRKLVNGRTLHGAQFLHPEKRRLPLIYYYPGGGISDAFIAPAHSRNIGVIGLGTGATAAFARKGEELTFFEIDPDNEIIARRWFTYLDDSPGSIQVAVGDGRASLQNLNGGNVRFDVLLMDAFSGGGIPTHLLTREAVTTYLSRLKEDGILLFHISNKFYDLRPIIKAVAADLGLPCAAKNVDAASQLRPYENPTRCMAIAKKAERLVPLLGRGWKVTGPSDGIGKMETWTDDYVNILAPLTYNLRNVLGQKPQWARK